MMLGLIALAVLLLIAAALLSRHTSTDMTTDNTPSTTPTAHVAQGLSADTFDGRFAGFKIHPPAGWTVDRNIPTIHVTFINPQPDTDAAGPFKANINVATQVANGVSLDEFMQATKKNQQSTLTNYKEVIDRTISIQGVKGHIVEATFLENNRQLHVAQLVVIQNNNAYIVTGTTLDSAWGKYKTLIDHVEMSLTLTGVQ